jgi:hypothetical protein
MPRRPGYRGPEPFQPGEGRQPAAGREDPVRGRGRGRVRVHRLGLDHSPNCIPSDRTSSKGRVVGQSLRRRTSPESGDSPCRLRNQPSSSTNRSVPTAAARSAGPEGVEVLVEVDRLLVLRMTGRGVVGWLGRARSQSCSVSIARPARRLQAPTTHGRVRLTRARRTSPGISSLTEHGVPACGQTLRVDPVVAAHATCNFTPRRTEPEPAPSGDEQQRASWPP